LGGGDSCSAILYQGTEAPVHCVMLHCRIRYCGLGATTERCKKSARAEPRRVRAQPWTRAIKMPRKSPARTPLARRRCQQEGGRRHGAPVIQLRLPPFRCVHTFPGGLEVRRNRSRITRRVSLLLVLALSNFLRQSPSALASNRQPLYFPRIWLPTC
jgi:hypothetical protein